MIDIKKLTQEEKDKLVSDILEIDAIYQLKYERLDILGIYKAVKSHAADHPYRFEVISSANNSWGHSYFLLNDELLLNNLTKLS